MDPAGGKLPERDLGVIFHLRAIILIDFSNTRGVNNGIQMRFYRGIIEDDGSSSRTVDRAVGPQNRIIRISADRHPDKPAGRDHRPGDFVGVDDASTGIPKESRCR